MARPRKKVDEKLLRELAQIHCTMDEIAAVVGVSKDTLERRYAAVIKEGRDEGKSSIRRAQYLAAMKGNTAMLIWLGKQLLDQRDRLQTENETTVSIEQLDDATIADYAKRFIEGSGQEIRCRPNHTISTIGTPVELSTEPSTGEPVAGGEPGGQVGDGGVSGSVPGS